MCEPQGITENNTQQFFVPLDAPQILIDHQNKKEKIARRRTKQQKRKFDKQNGSDFKDLIHEEVTKLPESVLLNVDLSNLKEKPQDKKEGSQQQEESSKRQKIDICLDSKMKQFSQQKEKVVGIGLHKITKSIEQENEKEKQRKAYRPMFTKLLHQLSGVTTPKNHQFLFVLTLSFLSLKWIIMYQVEQISIICKIKKKKRTHLMTSVITCVRVFWFFFILINLI